MEKQVSEGSLHKWFKGSKSKDGKGGWVNVVTGGTCASDEPGEGTPKCVSSSKRASMTKAERLSAARRKKKADPGQQQKSGAAKPTYVSTDKKKKKMKESYTRALTPLSEKAVKCWKGYEKKGTKKMFGKTVNNCVKKEEVEIVDEAMSSYDRNRKAAAKRAADRNALRRAGKMGGRMERETYRSEGGTEMHYKGYKANANEEVEMEAANSAQQAAIAISKKDRLEKMLVAKKKKQKMYAGYEPQGEVIDEKNKGDEKLRKDAKPLKAGGLYKSGMNKEVMGDRAVAARRNIRNADSRNAADKSRFGMMSPAKETEERKEKHKASRGVKTKGMKEDIQQEGAVQDFAIKKINQASEYMQKSENPVVKSLRKVFKVKGGSNYTPDGKVPVNNSFETEGETIEEGDKKGKGSGSKDACYHKVKSRYSVWPSAYASGALVKCRKVGAANWGNSSKKEDFSDWKAEFIWEDGDSAKKIEEASSPAWQRKEGKSESGGLNKKGVASYRAANPGSKLKTAVTTKPSKLKRGSKSAKRRKSFCSRMKGMKKKLTSAKTARDPDSRINKALRKWNC